MSTGAEVFSQLLARIEHVCADYPEEQRLGATLEMLGGAAIGAATAAFENHCYAEGQDIIVLTHHFVQEAGARLLQATPGAGETISHVCLNPADDPPSGHTNALSAAELAALGLEPEAPTLTDVIAEKLADAPTNGLGDPERYQFHEKPRSSTYAPLDFRCAREGADGIACSGDGAWHVNIATMTCGPIVRFLCAEHCRREVSWAYPEGEYVMHEYVDHIAFNRRRKPKKP